MRNARLDEAQAGIKIAWRNVNNLIYADDTTLMGHPKHSNINKMKRQRNTQQVKEQDKCPPNQTKEEEIGNLPIKNSE